jgi:hypothetical protein
MKLKIFLGLLSLLLIGCFSNANDIDYHKLYNKQFILNKVLVTQNDSLRHKINYLNLLVHRIDSVYTIIFSQSTSRIDSLKDIIATKDSNTIFMLNVIQNSLENMSDAGLNYLIWLNTH